jgi:tetratricopeptide (TPR) repeat protein
LASRYRLVEEIEPNQVDHQKVYQYRFRHAVFQSYLHENLSLIQRELYHAQVGQALEALYAEHVEQVASKLVSHFKIAGDKPRLVKYALQAADRAQHLGASQDAITLYQLALENVQVSEGARQAQTASYICERLGDVYLENLSCHDEALDQYQEFFQTTESELQRARAERKIAAILTLQGDLDQAQKQYESALHRISGKSLSAEAGRIHCGLAYLKIYKSDFDAAQEHARTAAEVASRLEYAEGIADANNALGHIAAYRGDFEASRGFLSTSLQVYRQLGDLPRTAKILNNLGEVSRLLGQMQAAQEYLEQGLGIARRVGDKREEAAVLSTLGDVYRDMGSWEHAVEILEQALPVAEQSGVAIRLIEVHWFLGGAYQQLDQIGRAKDHLEQAERISREKGFSHYLPKIYLELACLFSKEAERDKALAYLERARQAAGEDPGEEFLGQLQCVSGELYQDSQDWEHAIACYQQALVYLGRGGVPAKAARAHLGLGSCYLQRGLAEDRPRARENLQAAQQEFQRIGAEAYLQQVAAQLERLEQGVV